MRAVDGISVSTNYDVKSCHTAVYRTERCFHVTSCFLRATTTTAFDVHNERRHRNCQLVFSPVDHSSFFVHRLLFNSPSPFAAEVVGGRIGTVTGIDAAAATTRKHERREFVRSFVRVMESAASNKRNERVGAASTPRRYGDCICCISAT